MHDDGFKDITGESWQVDSEDARLMDAYVALLDSEERYRLDNVDAFSKRLVEEINSKGVSIKDSKTQLFLNGAPIEYTVKEHTVPLLAPHRSRTVGLTACMLPTRDRERWAEEWAGEWQDLRERPFLTRLAFLTRLLVRTGPALAWVLRVQKRREAA
ncbi:hypothetical protein ACFY8W_05730 [Streptomyces sp. NPDC012637]|uniref:hypothetical protein n=1 Tax=Streptomyces sp. NPDC012637 TaxID=3364842 RepID=UPI0036EDED8E